MCVMPMRCEGGSLISVLMGVRYRREDTQLLERSVRSIQEQTYQSFELLVCDDGSTAEAKKLLKRLAGEDTRIQLIRDPACLDLARKLNLCLKTARGRYIARMDDDDWSRPDRLEKQVRFLEEHEGTSFVGCNVACVQDGQYTGDWRYPAYPKVEDFYILQPYIHPALMFRREALEAVGGYSEDPSCALCEDYDLLLRMYKAGYVGANIQESLLDYTVWTGANRKMHDRMNEVRTRYRRFRDLGKLPGAWPYVVKPIMVGLLPGAVRERMRKKKVYGE